MSALRWNDVAEHGLPAGRHLRGDVYETVYAARMPRQRDFLDELDAERTAANTAFPATLAAARERRALIAQLAAKRRA